MIRKECGSWTNEAREFAEDVMSTLQPVFDTYKDKFNFEEIFYIVSTTMDEIIINELLGLTINKNKEG